MTGYGRAQQVVDTYQITVELRSINHRYFEMTSRLLRVYGFLEDKLKTFVHDSVARGKVDLFLDITALDDSGVRVQINQPLAQSYLQELRLLGEALALADDVTLSQLATFQDVFTVEKISAEEEALWELVAPVTGEALAQLLSMREAEGAKTKADLLARLQTIDSHLAVVETLAPQSVREYEARLYAKLQEVVGNHQLDERRVLMECALFADKVAVDEETVRLHSHLAQLRAYLEQAEPVGRKLDFLVQELHREINTIGSKSQHLEISRLVVELKSETEKIKEQVQNIE